MVCELYIPIELTKTTYESKAPPPPQRRHNSRDGSTKALGSMAPTHVAYGHMSDSQAGPQVAETVRRNQTYKDCISPIIHSI